MYYIKVAGKSRLYSVGGCLGCRARLYRVNGLGVKRGCCAVELGVLLVYSLGIVGLGGVDGGYVWPNVQASGTCNKGALKGFVRDMGFGCCNPQNMEPRTIM